MRKQARNGAGNGASESLLERSSNINNAKVTQMYRSRAQASMLWTILGCCIAFCGTMAAPAFATPAALVTPAPLPRLTTLGDSITAGAYGSSYTVPLATALGMQLTNLGIGGEFSGPVDFQQTCTGCARITYGGILADEVPKIPLQTTIVTLYVGTNDRIFLGELGMLPDMSNALTIAQGVAVEYDANIKAIVAGVRARVPNARIILATVPNGAWRPTGKTWPLPLRKSITYMSNAFKKTLVDTGLPVVDLMCEPAMYDDANFGGPTDVHPVASGFAVVAADFAATIRHPKPAGHCKYEAL